MQRPATTVSAYLAALPADRRAALGAIRRVIRANLDPAFAEGMQYGMIGYYVPHRVFPPGYHCDPTQPLPFAGLASQKHHIGIYLMSLYNAPADAAWFRAAWAKTGKRLDMGKSCIRVKSLDDCALDVIGRAVKRVTATQYIARYQAALGGARARSPKRATAKASPKRPAGRK